MDLPADVGTFDYIIAHGVYSWVPDAVRDGLMALLAERLAPHGVAFVSYNALPGGHLRRMTREMMRYHVEGIEAPGKRVEQARALLDFLLDAQPDDAPYRVLLEKERELSHKYTAEHFFHDHLAEINHPFYFNEFVDHAERHGLQYLAEADFAAMQDRTFPSETRAVLGRLAGDPVRREQYMDFLRNRMLRQTLLCRADAPVQRIPLPDRVRALTVAAPIRQAARDEAAGTVTFEGAGGKAVQTGHPFAKAVCEHIGAAWPGAVPFEDLWAAVDERAGEGISPDLLAGMLLDFYADGFVHLHTHAPTLARDVSEHPEASAVARRQAEEGPIVTNGWHRSVALAPAESRVLPLLDGHRDRAAILDALNTSNTSSDGAPVTDDDLTTTLRRFVQHALLVA